MVEDKDYISLKEHLTALFEEKIKNIDARLDAMDKASDLKVAEAERNILKWVGIITLLFAGISILLKVFMK